MEVLVDEPREVDINDDSETPVLLDEGQEPEDNDVERSIQTVEEKDDLEFVDMVVDEDE